MENMKHGEGFEKLIAFRIQREPFGLGETATFLLSGGAPNLSVGDQIRFYFDSDLGSDSPYLDFKVISLKTKVSSTQALTTEVNCLSSAELPMTGRTQLPQSYISVMMMQLVDSFVTGNVCIRQKYLFPLTESGAGEINPLPAGTFIDRWGSINDELKSGTYPFLENRPGQGCTAESADILYQGILAQEGWLAVQSTGQGGWTSLEIIADLVSFLGIDQVVGNVYNYSMKQFYQEGLIFNSIRRLVKDFEPLFLITELDDSGQPLKTLFILDLRAGEIPSDWVPIEIPSAELVEQDLDQSEVYSTVRIRGGKGFRTDQEGGDWLPGFVAKLDNVEIRYPEQENEVALDYKDWQSCTEFQDLPPASENSEKLIVNPNYFGSEGEVYEHLEEPPLGYFADDWGQPRQIARLVWDLHRKKRLIRQYRLPGLAPFIVGTPVQISAVKDGWGNILIPEIPTTGYIIAYSYEYDAKNGYSTQILVQSFIQED